MTLGAHVRQSQDGGPAQLTLDREIEMLSVGQAVMNVVSGEIRQGLVNRETERLVGRTSRNRGGEWEALSFAVGASIQPISVWLGEVNGTWTGPVQAKGSVSHFIEQIQILNRGVVQPVGGADAAFSRSAKDLAQRSFAKTRRVSQTKARPKFVVPGRRQRLGNAGIARIYQALGGIRKDGGLLSLNPGLDFS